MALNIPLKIAVIKSGKDQNEVAALAKMHYARLSQIMHGRVVPNESEKLRIAGVLQRKVTELFPDEVSA